MARCSRITLPAGRCRSKTRPAPFSTSCFTASSAKQDAGAGRRNSPLNRVLQPKAEMQHVIGNLKTRTCWALLAACAWAAGCDEPPPASPPPPPPKVEVSPVVSKEVIDHEDFTGQVEAMK